MSDADDDELPALKVEEGKLIVGGGGGWRLSQITLS